MVRDYSSNSASLLSQILKGAPTVEGRPGASLPALDFPKYKAELVETFGDHISDKDVVSSALYPKVRSSVFLLSL